MPTAMGGICLACAIFPHFARPIHLRLQALAVVNMPTQPGVFDPILALTGICRSAWRTDTLGAC